MIVVKEKRGEVDLSSSADVEAGLSGKDLELARASAELEQAFKEATARSSEQAVAAHPGVAEQPMQVCMPTCSAEEIFEEGGMRGYSSFWDLKPSSTEQTASDQDIHVVLLT